MLHYSCKNFWRKHSWEEREPVFVNIRLYLLRVSRDIDVLRVHSCLRVLNAMQVCQIYVFPSYSLRILLLLITWLCSTQACWLFTQMFALNTGHVVLVPCSERVKNLRESSKFIKIALEEVILNFNKIYSSSNSLFQHFNHAIIIPLIWAVGGRNQKRSGVRAQRILSLVTNWAEKITLLA